MAIIRSIPDQECAKKILEVSPRLMIFIRGKMRANSDLSVPQFRVLARLAHKPSTNTELAEWQGISTPTMCRIVDGLVERGFIRRDRKSTQDRRQIKLHLTKKGLHCFESIRNRTRNIMSAEIISSLSEKEKVELIQGLEILARIFP